MADDDAGQYRQRPADRAGREEGVVAAERPVEAAAEDERGHPDDRRGQRGPGDVPFGFVTGRASATPCGEPAGTRGGGGYGEGWCGALPARAGALRRTPRPEAGHPRTGHPAQAQP